MKTQDSLLSKAYTIIYLILVFALTVYVVVISGVFSSHYNDTTRRFSDNWITETGENRYIKDVSIPEPGAEVVVTKKIPGRLLDNDCLCLESRNTTLHIYIDDREIYEFIPEKNITGFGYGVAFHEIPLDQSYGGHVVTIKFSCVNPQKKYGEVTSVYLSSPDEFFHIQVRNRLIPAFLSLFVVLLGLTMMIIYLRIPDKNDLPFSIIALSMIAILIGSWLFVDTKIMQLITGHVYLWRGLNRYIILFALYPCVLFVNSLTKLKRRIYQFVALMINIIIVAAALVMRLVLDIDTTISFSPLIGIEILLLSIMTLIILLENYFYIRDNGLLSGFKGFTLSLIILFATIALDLLAYWLKFLWGDSYGTFTRVGMVLFMITSLFQFLKWWTRDRANIQRDRFINKILQYAVSYSPEDSIRLILEFMGTELHTARIGIFEKQENGKFRGTYEWFREDLESAGMELLYLPQEGLFDEMYKAFYANQHKLIISNPEEYKTALPALYSILLSNEISSLVSGPLESNGKLVGWLAFIDTPSELQEETAEVIAVISYFLTQLIVQREEQKRLRYYSYNDPLSGALNRRAFMEYLEKGLDKSSAFGYLICDIDGLEAANSSGGYEAGDKMVIQLVQCLTDVFGEGHVYRMGGAEFAAFGFETDEAYFNSDVDRARKMAREKGIKISAGAVYCAFGTMGMQRVLTRANELMKEEQKGL